MIKDCIKSSTLPKKISQLEGFCLPARAIPLCPKGLVRWLKGVKMEMGRTGKVHK